MSISPSTNPLYEQIILLTGPDSAEFTGATIQLDHSLALGSLNAPSVHQATIAPGPLSAWSAPYTLLDTDNITKLIEIPKPPLEIIRNEPGQDIYGQDQILIEGRLSGRMISVQSPLPQDGRMPATVEGNATLDFVGTFHISEISGGLMMTCSAGH